MRSNEVSVGPVPFYDLYLVKSMTHTHDGEVALTLEGRHDVVCAGQWLLGYHDVLVDLPVITTQSPGPRRLLDHDHR